jgi:hypothetical protein
MIRFAASLSVLGLLLGSIVLAGCPLPGGPVLTVQPAALTLTTASTGSSFQILNSGSGTLTWQISEDIPWLSLSLPDGPQDVDTLQGSTSGVSNILLNLVSANLPQSTSTGEIFVTSNGGSQSVAVSISIGAQAQLSVTPEALDFGFTVSQRDLVLTNLSAQVIDWSVNFTDAPWASASKTQGRLENQGEFQNLTITANRTSLAPGNYQGTLTIASNGGNFDIPLTIQIPAFSVSPSELTFGVLDQPSTSFLQVRANGTAPIAFTVTTTTDTGANWLSASINEGTAIPGQAASVAITADPGQAPAGAFTGQVTIATADQTYSISIPVSVRISGFAVAPVSVDFGTIREETQEILTLTNTSPTAVDFAVNIPPAAQSWLSASPAAGSVNNVFEVILTANPLAVEAGKAYETTITVSHEELSESIAVSMRVPLPPTLSVSPKVVDFGASAVEQTIAIWNAGIGSIDWSIDTTAFPNWLTATPINGQGVASGTVSGDQTDLVTLRVDRSLAPQGQETIFSHVFSVNAAGDTTTGVEVTARITVPTIPQIEIVPEGFDAENIPYINFDVDENQISFVIRNIGNGVLTWRIELDGAPVWITSVTPSQGSLDPQREQTITIAVDRSTLTYLGDQRVLMMTTNDPDFPVIPINIEVQVPKRVVIGIRPSSLAFGPNETTQLFEVANLGDPDTILNFRIAPSKDWLSIFPSTGSSIGTASNLKDWRTVSVSIDRVALDGTGGAARLLVTAYEVQDGEPIPLVDVEAQEATVSVEIAELTIESAPPDLRIPSLVRTHMLLRNVLQQPIDLPNSFLPSLNQQFAIFENDNLIEAPETVQFMSGPERLRNNALILLDYSGSMLEAALSVDDETIANAPDPLGALYARCILPLIDELPENYDIGLAIFNERTQQPPNPEAGLSSVRVIRESDTAPIFVSDRAQAFARFNSISVVDYGATQLLEALQSAALATFATDFEQKRIPFDDKDVKALIVVTDGRTTTPSFITVNELQELYASLRVSLYSVGWGEDVTKDPLIRISQASGGHFYPTQNQPTGSLDAFGVPIRKPVVSQLTSWFEKSPANECDQSIANDLSKIISLNYVTLTDEANVSLEARTTFNSPADQDSPCLPEQGEITGAFQHRQLPYADLVGDVRLGQVSLRTEGISGGTAVIQVDAEYIPRNVSQISFNISAQGAGGAQLSVSKVRASDGGILSNWNDSRNGNIYTYTSDTGAPLAYGDFGRLVDITVTGVAGPFTILFDVSFPFFTTAQPEQKYFTAPDAFFVDFAQNFAPAFPSPRIESTVPFAVSSDNPFVDDPMVLNFGSGISETTISISNVGGSHAQTGVGLFWEATASGLVIPLDAFGTLYTNPETDSFTVSIDRSIEPNTYVGELSINYILGSLGISLPTDEILVNYTILSPALTVSTSTLNFGTVASELPLTITNTGQSVLNWTHENAPLLPQWLTITSSGDRLGADESTAFLVRVNRSEAPGPGNYAFTLVFGSADGQIATVDVQMTVP